MATRLNHGSIPWMVIVILKETNGISSASGHCNSTLRKLIEERFNKQTESTTVSQALRTLEEKSYILRRVEGRKTYAVHLNPKADLRLPDKIVAPTSKEEEAPRSGVGVPENLLDSLDYKELAVQLIDQLGVLSLAHERGELEELLVLRADNESLRQQVRERDAHLRELVNSVDAVRMAT